MPTLLLHLLQVTGHISRPAQLLQHTLGPVLLIAVNEQEAGALRAEGQQDALQQGRDEDDAQQQGPQVPVAHDGVQAEHLGNEDADNDAQLVQGAQGPSKGRRRHLPHVHGHEACGQATVHTDDEAAQDHHLKGLAQFREAHEHRGHEGQQVHHQH